MKPVSVLVVEDNEGDALLMRTILSAGPLPVKLTIAENGEDALVLLGNPEFKPDLILTDLHLPGISGEEFLAACRTNGTPLVVFSSSLSPSDAARARQLGARELVEKPASLDAFEDTLNSLISKWAVGTG
jgi:two-component system, chemotaxis family, response regulator Rcp1